MAQVIVDPQELRRFAGFLEQAVGQLRERKKRMAASMNGLKEAWRDAKYADFERRFTQTSTGTDRFIKEAEAYCAFLRKKADLAERYLRRR